MSGCTCKCHETHPRLHCLKCAPSFDSVGDAMESVERFNRRMQQTPLSPVLPDLTEMWARVFEEGVKNG